ncbi:MAG: hypothetical protein U9P36_12705 [Thermodesulfobacteriota bacterium]|nr:hypothetical protein [Thermodesulfobacteriota bacterium]
MNIVMKIGGMMSVLLLMLFADIPLLPVELVPDAHAIFGVRRRTAVVAYSAGAAKASSANAAAASSQQQAAAAQQQAAAAEREAAAAQQQLAASQAAQTGSSLPIGAMVEKLPEGCTPFTMSNVQYQKCGDDFYRTAFQGNKLVFVVSEKPL